MYKPAKLVTPKAHRFAFIDLYLTEDFRYHLEVDRNHAGVHWWTESERGRNTAACDDENGKLDTDLPRVLTWKWVGPFPFSMDGPCSAYQAGPLAEWSNGSRGIRFPTKDQHPTLHLLTLSPAHAFTSSFYRLLVSLSSVLRSGLRLRRRCTPVRTCTVSDDVFYFV